MLLIPFLAKAIAVFAWLIGQLTPPVVP